MKKKLIFIFAVIAMLVCLLAISANADYIYKDASGNQLFSYQMENSIIKNETGVGFAKEDSDGYALTWYITATETDESGNTIYTVASARTADIVTLETESGSAKRISKTNTFKSIETSKVVSVNFDLSKSGITVVSIGSNVFNAKDSNYTNGNELLFAYLPSTFYKFYSKSFYGAKKLLYVYFPDEVTITSWAASVFAHSPNIREFRVPKSTEPIPDYLLLNCKSVKTVTFHPDCNVTTIGKQFAKGCTSLESIELPSTVTTIGSEFISECSSIQRIIFPNSLVTLGGGAFYKCYALKEINFGASFQGILTGTSYAFYHCYVLEKVVAPASFFTNCNNSTYKWNDQINNTTPYIAFYSTGTEAEFVAFAKALISAGGNAGATALLNSDKTAAAEGRFFHVTACDAFYNGDHLGDDGDCQTACTCTRCNTTFEAKTHVIKVNTFEYPNGYAKNGVRTFECTNSGCSKYDVTNETKEPLFVASGYSLNPAKTGITSGWIINFAELKEFESVNRCTLNFGIFVGNADSFTGADFIVNGAIANTYGIQFGISARDYAKVICTVDDFTASEATLPLVFSLYVIDENGIEYIQKDGSYSGQASPDGNPDNTLTFVTIKKIAEILGVDIFEPVTTVKEDNE